MTGLQVGDCGEFGYRESIDCLSFRLAIRAVFDSLADGGGNQDDRENGPICEQWWSL